MRNIGLLLRNHLGKPRLGFLQMEGNIKEKNTEETQVFGPNAHLPGQSPWKLGMNRCSGKSLPGRFHFPDGPAEGDGLVCLRFQPGNGVFTDFFQQTMAQKDKSQEFFHQQGRGNPFFRLKNYFLCLLIMVFAPPGTHRQGALGPGLETQGQIHDLVLIFHVRLNGPLTQSVQAFAEFLGGTRLGGYFL